MWQEIESDFPALYSLYIFPYILLYSLNGGASWLIVSSSTKLLYYITKCYLFKIAMHGKIGKLIGVKLMILCLDITGRIKPSLAEQYNIGKSLCRVNILCTFTGLPDCLFVCQTMQTEHQQHFGVLASHQMELHCLSSWVESWESQPLLVICHPVDLVLAGVQLFSIFTKKNFTWLF